MANVLSRSMLHGLAGKGGLGMLVVASTAIACGGTTFSGGNGSNVNESTGGQPGDAGSTGGNSYGGATNGGAPNGGVSNGGAPYGGAGGMIWEGTGGQWGAGGAVCFCPAIACASGYHSVFIPGQCCPSCVACTVDCPAIPCGQNQEPYTPPGECCPTSCVDVTLACTLPSTPTCLASGTCKGTWSEAIAAYGTCDPPPAVALSLARCGSYHAILDYGIDTFSRYYYDDSGKLVGAQYIGLSPSSSCEAYVPSFIPPSGSCVFEPHCGGAIDAGPPSYCGDGKVEQGEACDGVNLGAQTCVSATQGKFTGGTLKCSSTCQFDISGCTTN